MYIVEVMVGPLYSCGKVNSTERNWGVRVLRFKAWAKRSKKGESDTRHNIRCFFLACAVGVYA